MTEPDNSSADRWPFGAAGWFLVAAAFAIGFFNYPLQVVGREFDYVPGDLIDNRLNQCVLEHGYQYLSGKADRFWDAGYFYPVRGVTAWSDAHIGMLPIYSALRVGGLSPERAFQGWFLIPFVLNFAAAVWGGRRLGLGPVGAGAAAFVFAFGMPLAAQGSHSQLVPRFLVPLVIVFAWEWLRAPRGTWRVAAGAACGVYQTYTSVYIGYLLGLVLAAGFLVAVVMFRGRLPWRDLVWPGWRGWGGRIVVVLLVAGTIQPLVSAHTRGGSEVPREYIHRLAPRALAWLTPPGMSAGYPEFARYTKMGSTMVDAGEEQLFLGLLPLLAVAIGLFGAVRVLVRRKPFGELVSVVAVGACSSVLLALLVTKFGERGEIWCYEALLRLPGAGGIRATSRVVLVLLFPMGIVLGALLDAAVRGWARVSPVAAVGAALIFLGAVAADQRLVSVTGERKDDWWWARTQVSECANRSGRLVTAARADPAPKIVYAFPSVADWLGAGGPPALQLDAMRAAQTLGVFTANGWSGHFPHDWEFPRTYRELLDFLKAHDVPEETLSGLVVFGDPDPDPDPAFERAMRVRFPPRAIPAAP